MSHLTLSLPNSTLAFKMCHIEGGIFDMGSNNYDDEKPIHKVQLSEFWLCEVPVTQALWTAVMGTNPSYFKGENRPVENVSWDDIMDKKDDILNKKDGFLAKINKITEGVRPEVFGHQLEYGLPTEAQWEYAARGGKYSKEFSFKYSGGDKLNEVAWFSENSHGETKPVGLKAPNFLGLHDMSGNVWEWCEDLYDSQFYEKCEKKGVVPNPCNREQGTKRVYRGGGWHDNAEYCRPTFRNYDSPSYRSNYLGFRLGLFFSPSVLGGLDSNKHL